MIGVAKQFNKENKAMGMSVGIIKTKLSPTRANKAKLRNALFSSFPTLEYFVIFDNDDEFVMYRKQSHFNNIKYKTL